MNDLIPIAAAAVFGAIAIGDWRWREYQYRKARESELMLTLESDTAEFFRLDCEHGQTQRKHGHRDAVGNLEKGSTRDQGCK